MEGYRTVAQDIVSVGEGAGSAAGEFADVGGQLRGVRTVGTSFGGDEYATHGEAYVTAVRETLPESVVILADGAVELSGNLSSAARTYAVLEDDAAADFNRFER